MRRLVTCAAAILVAASAVSASAVSAQTTSGKAADEAAIRKLPQEYQTAWNNRNAQQIGAMYATDALEIEPTGEVLEGRSAIENNLKDQFSKMGDVKLALQTDSVRFLAANTAVLTGKSSVTGGQMTGSGQGTYMVVVKKIDGAWKVSEVHLADVMTQPQPQSVGTAGRSSGAVTAATDVANRWTKAVLAGDSATLDRLYAPDYTFTAPNGQLMTRDEDLNQFRNGNLKFESFEQSDMQTRAYGDTAVTTGIATIKGTHNGMDVSGRYRWTDVLVLENGDWKIVSSQVTPVREMNEIR